MEHPFTNALARESSPYLLQHAHNPVNWYPWGEEAWKKAREEDKPVIVSIGYSACHWCHVMERESFEDETVAAFMNEHFINIKIDREERPDLDQIYMDAVTAISGSGGWPLNVFLTPQRKPFYGGTYFPPRKAFNRPSWMDVLTFMTETWKTRRSELEDQANHLTHHIQQSNRLVSSRHKEALVPEKERFLPAQARSIRDVIMQSTDRQEGGFGKAPKFPQTSILQFLMAHSQLCNDAEALQQAERSLQKMIRGGIYDHLAGGMARYSTDSFWLVPHFEKMLYDNALLLMALADAARLTGKVEYQDAIDKTLCFLLTEMKHRDGGFYAALDADSEGEEGKFYVWDWKEFSDILGADAELMAEFFQVRPEGNWEGKNILTVPDDPASFAETHHITVEDLQEIRMRAERRLLTERNKRIRPQTDDKIILGWNALVLTALCRSFAATGREEYRQEALALGRFLLERFADGHGALYHTYKNGRATYPAFLDDYAYLIQGLLALQEISSQQHWLEEAAKLTEWVIAGFDDAESGYFFYTAAGQEDLVARKLDVFDQAMPSGNSVMADNLLRLSLLMDRSDWGEKAHRMISGVMPLLLKYPTSLAVWGYLVLVEIAGITELVITGPGLEDLKQQALREYQPFLLFQSCENESGMPLLTNRYDKNKLQAFVCRNQTCQAPVSDGEKVKTLIKITTI